MGTTSPAPPINPISWSRYVSQIKAGKSQKKKATAESDIKRKFHHCWQQIARLEKKLVAEQALDISILRDVNSKNF